MKVNKNLFSKTAGVFVLAVLVLAVFAMAACSSDDGGSTPSGNIGDIPLTLTGQVFTAVDDDDDEFTPPVYTKMTAAGPYTFTIDNYPGIIGGAGDITNGTLNFTADTPVEADLVPLSTLTGENTQFEDYDDVVPNPADAKAAVLPSLSVTIDGTYYDISKEKQTGSQSGSQTSGTLTIKEDIVTYIYVDKDVTITAKGKEEIEGFPPLFSITFKTNNTTLKLTKGWNAIYGSGSGKMTGSATGITGTFNSSMKVGNPDLQWSAWTYSGN